MVRMTRTLAGSIAAALLLGWLSAAVRAGDADEARPLPLTKSNILRSGGSYFIEGREEIPWAQELSVQKETRIVGRGAGATLVVGGALQARGGTKE